MNIRLIIFDFDGTLGDTRHNIVLTMQHMNKRLWNDVYFNRDVPDDVIRQLVHNSYDLIVTKLTKREREELFHLTDRLDFSDSIVMYSEK